MILCIRSESKEAYVALAQENNVLIDKTWEAHKQLSDTLLKTIEDLLRAQNSNWATLSGIVLFKGPGSFTGLRISATVANTLAVSLSIPIIGVSGEDWLQDGFAELSKGKNQHIVNPEYGGEANITTPRK